MGEDVDLLNSNRKGSLPCRVAEQQPSNDLNQEQWLCQKVADLKGVRSVDKFVDYCDEHNVCFDDQLKIIDRLHSCHTNRMAYRALLEYAQLLQEDRQLHDRLFGPPAAAPSLPQSDMGLEVRPSAPEGTSASASAAAFSTSSRTSLDVFYLSDAGVGVNIKVWQAFVERLHLGGYIDKEQIGDMEVLLGIRRQGSRLKRPIRFLQNKNEAAMLFAMLYGRLAYRLPAPMDADAGFLRQIGFTPPILHFEAGTYRLPNLIRVPGGIGLDADHNTRDPYWELLAPALHFIKATRPTSDPAHSLSNALKDCQNLNYDKVLHLLCLLRPLGLKCLPLED